MCADCRWRADRPWVYQSQGFTLCRDFVMPVVSEPPAQPAAPPPDPQRR